MIFFLYSLLVAAHTEGSISKTTPTAHGISSHCQRVAFLSCEKLRRGRSHATLIQTRNIKAQQRIYDLILFFFFQREVKCTVHRCSFIWIKSSGNSCFSWSDINNYMYCPSETGLYGRMNERIREFEVNAIVEITKHSTPKFW